jgi:NitT/TauT family transport system ATP-binding protein
MRLNRNGKYMQTALTTQIDHTNTSHIAAVSQTRVASATTTSALVSAQHVSKLYATANGVNWALDDVSLDIAPGEFVCAIGASGCGKTTLLNMLAGFVEPSQGSLQFDGAPLTGAGPDRGVVFQEYALFPWLTARRNIEFGLRLHGVDRTERRKEADRLLELVGLTRAADSYPFELSGGMRQRIAVARALATKPKLLLMDEPFAAIDALTRSMLQEELVKLWKELGISIFFITHNIEEAVFLGQRVVVMSAHPGRIKETINVDLPYPRHREDPQFGHYYAQISQAFAHHG